MTTTSSKIKPWQCLSLMVAAAVAGCSQEVVTADDSTTETGSSGGDGDGDPGDGDPGDGDGDGAAASVLLRVIPKAEVTIDGFTYFADNAGFLRIEDPGPNLLARIDAPGFSPSSLVMELSEGLDAYRKLDLLPLSEPLPFDAEAGGDLTLGDVTIHIEPGSLLNRFDEPVLGQVYATIGHLDPTELDFASLPAPFAGKTGAREDVLMQSLGMVEVSIWQDGHQLKLVPGGTFGLELIVPPSLAGPLDEGDLIPAWWLDVDEGKWYDEGDGTLAAAGNDLVWVAALDRFGCHNSDFLSEFEEFECFVVVVRDENDQLVSRGFGIHAELDGIFTDSGYSSLSDGNSVSNCVEAPIGSTVELAFPSSPGAEYIITEATGEHGLCVEDGVPNQSGCAIVEVMVPTSVACAMGEFKDECPYSGEPGTEGMGACEAGYDYCIDDGLAWSGCNGEFTPQPNESCATAYDDDCDGSPNPDQDAIDCECSEGETQPCYSGEPGTSGQGQCMSGQRTCDPATREFTGMCVGEVTPQMETCDNEQDEDCNGVVSEYCEPPAVPLNLQLSFSQVKQFDFSWDAAPGAQYYRLLEKNVGDLDYAQVGADTVLTTASITIPVLLHQRLGTSYVVEACNDSACVGSAPAEVVGSMVDAIGYFKASNAQANNQFGFSVALSADGNTLAVGAYGEESNSNFINGNQDDNLADAAGAVYVFIRDSESVWSQQAYVKASNSGMIDRFGYSVTLSGDGNTLAVGAIYESSGAVGVAGDQSDNSAGASGAVYVFSRNQDVWTQLAYIKASNTGAGDHFGNSVALSDDGHTLAVGAPFEDGAAVGVNGDENNDSSNNAGAVYVFARNFMDQWSQQAYVKASNNTGGADQFGWSVALSDNGNTLAVGAFLEDSDAIGVGGDEYNDLAVQAGAVYVFVRDMAQWSQEEYIKASNTGSLDWFGWSISLSGDGDTLVVGAYQEDSSSAGVDGNQFDEATSGAGAVYVFSRSMGEWSQEAYLKASNPGVDDRFGYSVAVSDDKMVIVGAYVEDSGAIGVDGNQDDNSVINAGAVYVYGENPMGQWTHQAYIKASNSGSVDRFGGSVAISDDDSTLAVGADGEHSGATGIGGDQLDNSADNAGAVFLY